MILNPALQNYNYQKYKKLISLLNSKNKKIIKKKKN